MAFPDLDSIVQALRDPSNMLPTIPQNASRDQIDMVKALAGAIEQRQHKAPILSWSQVADEGLRGAMGAYLGRESGRAGQALETSNIDKETDARSGMYGVPGNVFGVQPRQAGASQQDTPPLSHSVATTTERQPIGTYPVRNPMSEVTDPRVVGQQQGQGPGGPTPDPTIGRGSASASNPMHLAQNVPPGGRLPAPFQFMRDYVHGGGRAADARAIASDMMPKYDVDAYQRERMLLPGLPPIYTGRTMGPGKETKIGDVTGYATIGPDGREIIHMPRFEGDTSQAPGTPQARPTPGAAPSINTGGINFPRNPAEALTLKARTEAFKEGQSEQQKKSMEGLLKPINDAIERGGERSQDVLQVLDRIENAYDTMNRAGGSINGGPLRAAALGAQQAANQLATFFGKEPMFDPKSVALPEVIKKSTAELVLKQLKEANSRSPQREFLVMLDNNPGIGMSDAGSRYMTNIVRQQVQLDQKVAELASSDEVQANPKIWNKMLGEFYKRPENLIKSPLTGKPLVGPAVKEDEAILHKAETTVRPIPGAPPPPVPTGGPLSVRPPGSDFWRLSPEAQEQAKGELRLNASPQMRQLFDKRFGTGMSDHLLGNK